MNLLQFIFLPLVQGCVPTGIGGERKDFSLHSFYIQVPCNLYSPQISLVP